MHLKKKIAKLSILSVFLFAAVNCSSTLFLNPSFVNYTQGGVIPLAPRAETGFVLVRCVNSTGDPIEFVVSIEREVDTVDPITSEPITELETAVYHLVTRELSLTNETGILIDCPLMRVGLGEDLNRPTTSSGLYIGTYDAGTIIGFGVPANLNPLDSRVGNFSCGDTIIFEAYTASSTAGNVAVASYVLDGNSQATEYSGPSTFQSARSFIQMNQY